MGSGRALVVRSCVWILFAGASAGGCSFINHFDDVKPAASGAAGSAGSSLSSTTGPAGSGGADATSAGSGGTSSGGASGSGAGGDGATTTGSAGAASSTTSTTSSGAGGASGTGGSGSGGSAGGSMTADSGSDVQGGKDSGGVDAPVDSSIRPLNCHFVIGSGSGGHVKLDDYSSQPTANGAKRTLADKFFVMPMINTSSVRIVTQLGGNNDSYLVYAASDGGAMGSAQPVAAQGRVVDVKKVNSRVTGALIIRNGGKPDSDAGLATSTQLVLHSFDDSNASATPTVAALTLDGELGSTGSVDAHFLPSTDGKIALAAQFDVAPGMSRACYGLYSGSPVKMTSIFDDPNPDNVRPTSLVRVPGVAGYVFYGENPQYEYAIPDDPTTGAMPTRRPIAANGFVILANPNSTGKFNLASADLGTPLMPQLKLFTGQIDPTQIMTFDPKSFVLAKNATTLGEVPISAMNGYTDDFLLFAGPTGVSATELSILFLDVLGRTRAEQKLQDTRAPVNMAAIAPRGTVGGAGGKYHIAWSETNMDANGKYDVLYYDQIDCL